MKIALLNIATGRYIRFAEQLYQSINRFFLPGHEKTAFLFTDSNEFTTSHIPLHKVIQPRRGFPIDTLLRYNYFLSQIEELESYDALFYTDIDMRVVAPIGDEILPENPSQVIAVAHPGYFGKSLGTPETRPSSTACISPTEPRPYYWAGGFNGGGTKGFLEMAKVIAGNVATDAGNSLVAIWHDESHLNRYLTTIWNTTRHVKTLTPSYCYAEGTDLPFEAKIVALKKDHNEIRASD